MTHDRLRVVRNGRQQFNQRVFQNQQVLCLTCNVFFRVANLEFGLKQAEETAGVRESAWSERDIAHCRLNRCFDSIPGRDVQVEAASETLEGSDARQQFAFGLRQVLEDHVATGVSQERLKQGEVK